MERADLGAGDEGDVEQSCANPCPLTESLVHAFATLRAYGPDMLRIAPSADEWDAHVDNQLDNAQRTHAASVSVADEVLLSMQQTGAMQRRLRVRLDFSLALVIAHLRARHASRSRPPARASKESGNAKERWCVARRRCARRARACARVA